MPQSLSSMRIKRLNSLLTVLSNDSYITLEELLEKVKYPSARALGRDLQFLRKAFNVKITYSRHFHAYHLIHTGDFVLRTLSSKEE
jgi:predicted DNA-binding transcriptional regulator YafY